MMWRISHCWSRQEQGYIEVQTPQGDLVIALGRGSSMPEVIAKSNPAIQLAKPPQVTVCGHFGRYHLAVLEVG